ncbi:MAG: substrate-binding domain-containing protein [Microcoleaceae cyanobacterium]
MMILSWQRTILILFVLTLSACTQNNSNITQSRKNDPHVQFINAIEVPEALPVESQEIASADPQPLTATSTLIELPKVKPLDVRADNIRIVGSTGLAALNQRIYDDFVKQGFSGQIDIDATGTGSGIRLFCQREDIDIVTTSRPMSEAEKATCQAQGRQLVEFVIGNDALVIVVNQKNPFIHNATLEQLTAIFSTEKWSDINSNWPNLPIERFVSGPVSSTLDLLVDVVFSGDKNPVLTAPNTQVAFYDEPLAQGLSASRYGVAFFSYSFYKSQGQALKALKINGVEVNAKTLSNGSYLFPRKLYLYTDASVMQNKSSVSRFVNYYLTNVNEMIETVNYFPLTQQELQTAKLTWLNVMGIQTDLVENNEEDEEDELLDL